MVCFFLATDAENAAPVREADTPTADDAPPARQG